MALRRDRRRIVVASATLSAGALVFVAAEAGPATAATGTTVTSVGECKLGKLLCGLLGAGKGRPAAPPKPSAKPSGRPSAARAPKHRHKPKHANKAAPRSHRQGVVSHPVDLPAPPPAASPEVSSPAPALPDVPDRDPVVVPGSAASPPAEHLGAEPALLVAEPAPDGRPSPPLLVATASGLIGALAALNLSLLFRRREAAERRRPSARHG